MYLGFPGEFESRRGTIRRPYALSRMPYRSYGHPRNFDIFDLWGPWGGGVEVSSAFASLLYRYEIVGVSDSLDSLLVML